MFRHANDELVSDDLRLSYPLQGSKVCVWEGGVSAWTNT